MAPQAKILRIQGLKMSALGAKSCQKEAKHAENTVNLLKNRAPKARAKKKV